MYKMIHFIVGEDRHKCSHEILPENPYGIQRDVIESNRTLVRKSGIPAILVGISLTSWSLFKHKVVARNTITPYLEQWILSTGNISC